MSFAQRRRFLWICFLAGLLLLGMTAAFANATTFARLRFEDLAQQSTAVARLRCLGSEFRWERGELWTETRFEVLERNKGLLSGIVTVRTIGGTFGHLHSLVDGAPRLPPGRRGLSIFVGAPRRTLSRARLGARHVSHRPQHRHRNRNRHARLRTVAHL